MIVPESMGVCALNKPVDLDKKADILNIQS